MSNITILRDGEQVSVPYETVFTPVSPTVYTRISKYDLIVRLTDDELDNLQAELNLASSRLNLIWGAIMYIDTADPNYSTLRDVFVSQLGETRANEVLTPKE